MFVVELIEFESSALAHCMLHDSGILLTVFFGCAYPSADHHWIFRLFGSVGLPASVRELLVQAVTRFTAILNPIKPFTLKKKNSNPVDRTENKRDGKHEERKQNHRHQYMVWAASKLREKGPLG